VACAGAQNVPGVGGVVSSVVAWSDVELGALSQLRRWQQNALLRSAGRPRRPSPH